MKTLASIFAIILFFSFLNALCISTEGKSLFELFKDFGREIYYFFKNKEWKDEF